MLNISGVEIHMVEVSIKSSLLKSIVGACILFGVNILTTSTVAFSGELPALKTAQISTPKNNSNPSNGSMSESGSGAAEIGEIDIPDPNGIVQPDENSEQSDLIENTNTPEASPNILTNLGELPFPARKMHELILNAARTGDMEKLRPFIGQGDDMTMLSLGGFNDDPIDFLKSISGDPQGHELLAIITEILEADFVLLDEGTDREVYVWPYFYAYSLEKLSPQQRVKLFRLLTYGDYQEMESFGAYIFYRLGITPQGRWRFFVSGD